MTALMRAVLIAICCASIPTTSADADDLVCGIPGGW